MYNHFVKSIRELIRDINHNKYSFFHILCYLTTLFRYDI